VHYAYNYVWSQQGFINIWMLQSSEAVEYVK